jgi:hypothetical protein
MLCCGNRATTFRTLTLLPLLDLPTFEPSLNAYTRIELSRLDIREVERRDPLWWLHSYILRLRVLTDGGSVEFVCRVKRVWNAGCAQA